MWFFRKKPAPPVDRRDWNEDWRAGDIAECVNNLWHKAVKPWEHPRIGDRLVVVGFSEGVGRETNAIHYFLRFAEYPHGLTTSSFRKVRSVSAENSAIATRILNAKPGADKVRERA